MKPYRFLLFDADYTLLDFEADMLMAFEQLYAHCGFEEKAPYSAKMLDAYEKHNTKWWERFEAGHCTKPELFRGRFVDFLDETGFSGDPDRMNEAYFDFLGKGGILYSGAAEMLESLSKSHAIYIVTNGNAATAKTRIQNSGLSQYIRNFFVSEAVGCAKPDLRYFDHVFSHIPDFRKEEAIIIGDSLFSDIQGARNAGIDSIWFTGQTARPQENTSRIPYTIRAENYEEIMRFLADE